MQAFVFSVIRKIRRKIRAVAPLSNGDHGYRVARSAVVVGLLQTRLGIQLGGYHIADSTNP